MSDARLANALCSHHFEASPSAHFWLESESQINIGMIEYPFEIASKIEGLSRSLRSLRNQTMIFFSPFELLGVIKSKSREPRIDGDNLACYRLGRWGVKIIYSVTHLRYCREALERVTLFDDWNCFLAAN